MNVKHLPLYLGLGFTLAVSGVVSHAPQAQAQSGNQSDITGVIVTTSDISGGFNFSGGDRRRTIAFQSTSIQNSVNSAAISINQRLEQGTLPIVATDSSQTSISVSVQRNLQVILINEGNVSTTVTQYVNGLVSAGADQTLSQNLVTSLVGLTSNGTVQAAQCQTVIRAYNVFIENANLELLTNNPDELRAIRSVLAILLNAAYASR
jgi:hypothetical protein